MFKVFILILFTAASLAQAAPLCEKENLHGLGVAWCLHANPASPDILYYFHGGGGNEHSWTDFMHQR